MRPSPEEQARLKAEKEAKKAAKKAKFGEVNADQNLPVCEMRIPWKWESGKDIDLDTPKGYDWVESLEYQWRVDFAITQSGYDPSKIYRGPCKRKLVRT